MVDSLEVFDNEDVRALWRTREEIRTLAAGWTCPQGLSTLTTAAVADTIFAYGVRSRFFSFFMRICPMTEAQDHEGVTYVNFVLAPGS